MAGNYMDAPGPRLAWDKDGSVLVAVQSTGTVMTAPLATNVAWNSEDQSQVYAPPGFQNNNVTAVVILFPIKMNLVATFIAETLNPANNNTILVSQDTTNGADGTWTQVVTSAARNTVISPNYRIAINQINLSMGAVTTGLKGIKLAWLPGNDWNNFAAWFLYGYPTPSIPVDRLAFWEPTTNIEMNPLNFDWGNTPRSSSEDRSFRIKNTSATLNANSLTLGVESLSPGTAPTITGMFTFSWDDVNYYATLPIPNLAPGAISAVIYIRRVIPINAGVGVRTARVSVEVGAWV